MTCATWDVVAAKRFGRLVFGGRGKATTLDLSSPIE